MLFDSYHVTSETLYPIYAHVSALYLGMHNLIVNLYSTT